MGTFLPAFERWLAKGDAQDGSQDCRQIIALANGTIDQLIASWARSSRPSPAEEFAVYKRGIAKVIKAFDTEVIDPVVREHPDLKPPDDDFRSRDEHRARLLQSRPQLMIRRGANLS
jgi:hypothetical protein